MIDTVTAVVRPSPVRQNHAAFVGPASRPVVPPPPDADPFETACHPSGVLIVAVSGFVWTYISRRSPISFAGGVTETDVVPVPDPVPVGVVPWVM